MPPAPPPSQGRRLIQLDVLRGIAILLVLLNHSVVPRDSAAFLRIPAQILGRGGWTGVDLFFVLSGFLVGGLLLSELKTRGRVDIGRFIIRRIFKIWPAYYGLILLSLCIDASYWGFHAAFIQYLPNFLHLQNYAPRVDRVDHTWSLAVEEHFYLALPLLLWLLTSFGRRGAINALPWIALATVVLCNATRLWFNAHRLFHMRTHYKPTHLRMDSLAFGVLLAYLYHFRPLQFERIARRRWTLLILGLALIAPMGLMERADHAFIWTVGYTMLYLGYGSILIAAVHTPVGPDGGIAGRFFASIFARALATIGIYSYSIYLWHFDFLHQTMEKRLIPRMHLTGATNWFVGTGLYISAAFLVGMVLGKLIELPALVLRDRLFPSRARPLHETPET